MIAAGRVKPCPSWGVMGDLSKAAEFLRIDSDVIKEAEQAVEEVVSEYIGAMPFLWLDVGDEPSPESNRGYVERNAIALLSNFERPSLDPASDSWLGRSSDRAYVVGSGLWNQRHVEESYDPSVMAAMLRFMKQMAR
jgi:hypothetical protein